MAAYVGEVEKANNQIIEITEENRKTGKRDGKEIQ